jgi:protoporphyrinogen/coproporphyrinogen III oxidase
MSGINHKPGMRQTQSTVHRPQHSSHVIVIGGGIAGLSTAYTLQEQARLARMPVACTLIEAQERLGGVILTERVDDFVIEAGPDSLLTQKPWGLDLCRTLGIGDRLIATNDRQRKIYILWGGRLHPLPEGLVLIAPARFMPLLRSRLLSWPGKIRMGLEYFLPPRPSNGDESLAGFVRRRLGREALEKIADPLLAGIYAGSSDGMSVLATFPRLREFECIHGGLIRGALAQHRALRQASSSNGHPPRTLFMAPQGGMAEIVEALSRRLDQVVLRLGQTVQRVTPHGDGAAGKQGYVVHLDDATTLQADAVVFATPAPITASMVEGFHPRLAMALRTIPYVSSATVSLAYWRGDVSHPLDGFGFLVGKREGRRIMATTWSSTKFSYRAPADAVLIRSFVGGAGREDLVGLDDLALIQLVREELGAMLGITATPLLARVYRWERANPQYVVGHLERVDAMEQLLVPYRGIYLTGSAYRGVGVPDCIHQGALTAERIMAALTLVV